MEHKPWDSNQKIRTMEYEPWNTNRGTRTMERKEAIDQLVKD